MTESEHKERHEDDYDYDWVVNLLLPPTLTPNVQHNIFIQGLMKYMSKTTFLNVNNINIGTKTVHFFYRNHNYSVDFAYNDDTRQLYQLPKHDVEELVYVYTACRDIRARLRENKETTRDWNLVITKPDIFDQKDYISIVKEFDNFVKFPELYTERALCIFDSYNQPSYLFRSIFAMQLVEQFFPISKNVEDLLLNKTV